MNERAIVRRNGRVLGLLSGLVSGVQVLISVSSTLANQEAVHGLQRSSGGLTSLLGGVGFNLIIDLIPVLLMTYLSALACGAIMLGFAWYAGRRTALDTGWRTYGGSAGLHVALWCGLVWMVLSAVGVLLFHADGTITGIFTSSPATTGSELLFLLVQTGCGALWGLACGALAGHIGAESAPLDRRPPSVAQVWQTWHMYPGMNPGTNPGTYPGTYPGTAPGAYLRAYPGANPGGYPLAASSSVAPTIPWNGVYPPPPEFYSNGQAPAPSGQSGQ